MLNYLTLILSCQLAGELTTKALSIPAPGPVIGMLYLFLFLMLKGSLPNNLEETANSLLNNLSLLFVPAGVGVMLHFKLLGNQWFPLSIALFISTALTIAVTGLMMVWLTQDNSDETAVSTENPREGEIKDIKGINPNE